MEKLILALVTATRKLRLYFQSFSVVCMIEYPLRSILHNSDTSYRVTKWTIELGQHEIIYHLKTSIKPQALVDFVVAFTFAPQSIIEATSSQSLQKTVAFGNFMWTSCPTFTEPA